MRYSGRAITLFPTKASRLLLTVASALMIVSPAIGDELSYKCEDLEGRSVYSAFAVKIYQGHDGWFFRQNDLENLFELPTNTLSLLARINAALASRGVHLIILPMVPRGIVAGANVPNDGVLSDVIYDRDFAAGQFDAFIEGLNRAGLDVVNANRVLETAEDFDRGQYYFKRDIHWRPEGAELIAKSVGDHILELQGEPTSTVEFETHVLPQEKIHRANFNTIVNELCQSKIEAEKVKVYETKQKVASLDDLLSDQDGSSAAQIHVVGSSYTDDKTVYNFDGFLRERVKQNVSGFSVSGGGVTQSIYAWAQNPNGLAQKPRFLVWEFADFVDLRKLTESMNNSIVPAIVGGCDGELKLAEKAFEKTATVELDLPALIGKATDYYLAYDFSNKALTSFQSTYTYGSGATKTVSFENPTRVSGLAKLFQALPGGMKSAPVRVRLDLQGGAQSAGSVKLCRYPNGIFQDAPTSN